VRLQCQFCSYLVDEIIECNAFASYSIPMPDIANGSSQTSWPMLSVLTILLGKMLDVARYGQYGCKPHLYVNVGMFDHLEQSTVYIVTVTKIGIEKLIMQHGMILSHHFL
jgi:hypothetical protein